MGTDQVTGAQALQNPGQVGASAGICACLMSGAMPMGLSSANQHHPHIAHILGHVCTENGEVTMWLKPNALTSTLHADFESPQVTENIIADFGAVPHSHHKEFVNPPCCASMAYEHRLQLCLGMLLASSACKNLGGERCITYFCLVLCTRS